MLIGVGCMRLSTDPERDEKRAIAVIHAALDAGATLLDTADVYCLDQSDIGHNERLIARALRSWHGERARIRVATKGGMIRPGGKWLPDGRAAHLRSAAEASRQALGVDVIELYQLHVPDPKVPLETGVRALAALQRAGVIRDIGLSNVTVGQIQAARAIVPIRSVQNELSVVADDSLRNGVVEYCAEHGIEFLAYRPVDGSRAARLGKDPLLAELAAEHETTAQNIALAWLLDLGPHVVPLPGATRVSTAREIATVLRIRFSAEQRAALDRRFPSGRLAHVPRAQRRAAAARGDVVMVMGMPGSGKSTVAQELVAAGYSRLNRDREGGRLRDLVGQLEAGLKKGQMRWVLDNTYAARADRNDVIECGWRHGARARVIWVDTSLADAQINAVTRMIGALGRLPTPEEIRAHGRMDHRFFGPDAQFRYERELEEPTVDEGFESIERRAFVRQQRPGSARAVFFDPDAGTPRAEDYPGFLVLPIAWRPGGNPGEGVCTHPPGPPVCWCRKPLPGLALAYAHAYQLDLPRSLIIAASAADHTMAERLGLQVAT